MTRRAGWGTEEAPAGEGEREEARGVDARGPITRAFDEGIRLAIPAEGEQEEPARGEEAADEQAG